MASLTDRDLATLASRWISAELAQQAGGETTILHLPDGQLRESSVKHYVRRIKRDAVERRLRILWDSDTDLNDKLRHSDEIRTELSDFGKNNWPMTSREIIHSAGFLDEFVARRRKSFGLETGFRQFDDLTRGLRPGELVLIAARPSAGKTAFALDIIRWTAKRMDLATLLFSLEMPKDAIVNRLACAEARINHHQFCDSELSQDEMNAMARAYANDLRRKLLEAHEKGQGTLEELAGRFSVSVGYAKKISAARRRSGRMERSEQRHGRISRVTPMAQDRLRALLRDQPDRTLGELQRQLQEQ